MMRSFAAVPQDDLALDKVLQLAHGHVINLPWELCPARQASSQMITLLRLVQASLLEELNILSNEPSPSYLPSFHCRI